MRIEPTKLIIVGTRTTYQATGDAGCVRKNTFFFIPFTEYYLRPSVLSLLVVTQIPGHIAGSSPPLPTLVRALHFNREKIPALSSLLVISSDCAYPRYEGALTPLFMGAESCEKSESLQTFFATFLMYCLLYTSDAADE